MQRQYLQQHPPAGEGSSGSSLASGSGSGETVLLRVFQSDTKGTDDAMVADAINQLPEVKALGVTIEMVKYGQGEYFEKIPLVMASD